jgi:hypothetical protein
MSYVSKYANEDQVMEGNHSFVCTLSIHIIRIYVIIPDNLQFYLQSTCNYNRTIHAYET